MRDYLRVFKRIKLDPIDGDSSKTFNKAVFNKALDQWGQLHFLIGSPGSDNQLILSSVLSSTVIDRDFFRADGRIHLLPFINLTVDDLRFEADQEMTIWVMYPPDFLEDWRKNNITGRV